MSTTRTPSRPDYTVLGAGGVPLGSQRFDTAISLVILGRDRWMFRPAALEELYELGFAEILCVETAPLRYEAEALIERFPGIRFLVLSRECTDGEKINLAAEEIQNPRFLVLADNQRLPDAGLHTKVQKLWNETDALVIAPELRDPEGLEMPSVLVPSMDGARLKILTLEADQERTPTLFPQDFSGLYQRDAFLRTGGFDPQIAQSWWQKCDWGMRSHLWGERLVVSSVFRVDVQTLSEPEDQTARAGSLRFYLKNLAVRFTGDHAVLPWSRFLRYWRRSGSTFFSCLKEFRAIRAWVVINRYRFHRDAKLLVERWGALE